jgi:hypothetical protein
MVGMMVFCLSLSITLINVGLSTNFFQIWARAFGIAFAIALPVALVVSRVSMLIVARITE